MKKLAPPNKFCILKLEIVLLVFLMTGIANVGCSRNEPSQVSSVKTGLDVLMEQKWHPLKGKKVGVITNQTGVNSRGEHIADLLHAAPEVDLKALFGPEHGIRGQVEGGEKITSGLDPETGVPVISLYGKTRKPTPEMLEGLDWLIFDIQDVGARFYTYISTMSLAMEAAAENGVNFMVLDRPNPITGTLVEGPVLDPQFKSFVGIHPIPLRHGMTVGELARLFNEEGYLENRIQADLTVIKMENWRRDMWYEETGLNWINPSPNMPTPSTAVLYPGMGLLEATNVSEGRGTKNPFENVGAPWIEADQLMAKLQAFNIEGIAIQGTTFVPVDMPGAATNPKYEGETCQGVFLKVTDPHHFKSVAFGIRLLCALQELYPEKFSMSEKRMSRMTGQAWVRQAILNGQAPENIIARWQASLSQFKKIRNKYLLYKGGKP
jgi:uncharacterized protein YbbC (DUF1343 family)